MLEEQGRRVEQLHEKLVEDIDRKYIRKMQGNMYKCASNCCDDMTSSLQGLQRCIRECATPVENAQQYVQSESERAQKRLDRCFEECRDKVRDKVGPSATEESLRGYRGEYENCAARCLANHCDNFPQLEKSIDDFFRNKAHLL